MAEITTKSALDPSIEFMQVALGISGAWIALWSDKPCTWNLGGNYGKKVKPLTVTENGGIEFVALNAYGEN